MDSSVSYIMNASANFRLPIRICVACNTSQRQARYFNGGYSFVGLMEPTGIATANQTTKNDCDPILYASQRAVSYRSAA